MATYYYSGQGRVYVGDRNANGTADYLTALGNVPNLEISVEITKFEHKESMTGNRVVDLTIVQEKKGTFTMTLEELSLANLALAFWGETGVVASATAQYSPAITVSTAMMTEPDALTDKRIPIGKGIQKISNVSVQDTATAVPTTTYEFGTTRGTTAAPGASKNGYYDEANGVLVIFTVAEQTARGAAVNIADADVIYVEYDIAAATKMDAFTDTSQQKFLRFEGLNTVDNGGGGNKEVVIDIYKADLDPLSGYGLINEEIGSFEITGTILADSLQQSGSEFFTQYNVD
jgi:hypothetical protein